MPAKRTVNLVLLLLAFAAGLILLMTYGIALPSKPFASVKFDGPTSVDSDGTLTAVADSSSRRLMLLDDGDRLVSMIRYNSIGAPIEVINEVCVSEGMVYVSGLTYQKESDYIKEERVLAYDQYGAYRGIVYEVDDPSGYSQSIKSLHGAEYGCVIGVAESEDGHLSWGERLHFYRVRGRSVTDLAKSDGMEDAVHDGGYSLAADAYALTTGEGNLIGSFLEKDAVDLSEQLFSITDMGDDGYAYAYDELLQAICRIAPDGTLEKVIEGTGFTQVSLNGKCLSYCNRSDGEVGFTSDGGVKVRHLSEVMPTVWLSALCLLVRACRIYLMAFVLAFAAHRIYLDVKTGETDGMGALLASTSVVLALGIAIGYSSFSAYRELLDTRLSTINTFADYLKYSSGMLSDDVEHCGDRDLFHNRKREGEDEAIESYFAVVQPVNILIRSAVNNGIVTYACIYAQDDEGIFYVYDSADEHIYGTSIDSPNADDIEAAFDSDVETSDGILEGSGQKDETRCRYVPYVGADGATVRLVVEIGSHIKSFRASMLSTLTEHMASLLVILAVLYLTYSELRGCGRSLLDYREYRGKDNHDALVLLTRPFTFCVTALSSVDSVMTVLIAKQLAAPFASTLSSMLVALPSVMLGIGLAIGYILYGFIGSHVPPRQLGRRGCLALLAASVLAIVAISLGNLPLYCLAKLLLSIPLGTLYSFGYSLPRRVGTDKVRGSAQEGVTRTDTSAAAIGTIAGGYAAQVLGNMWVYVVVALVSVALMIFVRRVFPRHMSPIERTHIRSLKQTLQFMGSRSILPIIVFIMLPMVLAGGYDSFLFPLFSSGLGLSTSAIHNISAFGKVIVYVMIGKIKQTNDRLDKWTVVPASIVLIGFTFLMFSLNSTMSWAVAVIAIVAVLRKSSDGWTALWLRSAEQRSFPRGRATGMMFATRSMLLMVQPLVLSALLTAGEQVAVIALGVVCVVGAAAFWAVTRGSELVPDDWAPPALFNKGS